MITSSIKPILWLFLFAALGAGCDDPSSADDPADAGGDTDTDTDTDADGDSDADADIAVESYEPVSPPPVRINRKLHVTFTPGSVADDFIMTETVQLEVDGEPRRIWGYYEEDSGNREFRFVPFPVWEPGSEIEVTIAAGVEYFESGEAMADDLVWTFETEDTPFAEDYEAGVTPELSSEELAQIDAGGAVFQPANLVTDWEDPESSLYLISEPADPEDPEIQYLAEKLRDSLTSVSGIGLAAPQIGINRRVFGASLPGREPEGYINPIILDWADEVHYWQNGLANEGCLSIPGEPAKVARPAWIDVSYFTADGGYVAEDHLAGNEAVVFLHEYDHLNGILITDRQESR